MNYYSLAGCLLMVGLLVGCQPGEKKTLSDKGENVFPVSTHRALNPIAPPGVFIADPEVRQMPDGRVYIYGSRDEPGNSWCSHSYNVLSSSDLVNWLPPAQVLSLAAAMARRQVPALPAPVL